MLRLCVLFVICTGILQAGEFPPLTPETAVSGLKAGYQLVIADLDHDGRKDLIVVDERSTELAWYRAPDWTRHVLIANVPRVINLDTLDLDGDGIPEIAMAHGFETVPERSLGQILLLKSGANPQEPWTSQPIDRVPTAHRLRWMRVKGERGPLLIVAPLVGLKSLAPTYSDYAPIYAYRPGEWKRITISDDLTGVLHSIAPVDWGGNGQELLTASFDGLNRLEPRRDGLWKRHALTAGDTRPCPQCGSSEIKMGHLGKRRILAAIEPWHGNQVVIYRPEGSRWHRTVVDDQMTNGHALAIGDLDGDGRDEVVASFRGTGFRVTVFQADDDTGDHWSRHVIDQGGVAGADCKIDDLDGDGRKDVVCSGASTGNVKVYWNRSGNPGAKR